MYLPDHEKIPGYLNITCKFEEEVGWKKEEWFTFQYLRGKLFFLVYPTLVQFSLGEATSVEGAIEKEKNAIEAIWTGVSDADVAKILDPERKGLPSRMKELKELYEAGYQLSFSK